MVGFLNKNNSYQGTIPAVKMPENEQQISEKQFEEFDHICKRAGVKLTHQRLEIYRELAKAKDHPSAETIFHRVRMRIPTISLDTVYRTLGTFETHGIISRTQVSDYRARFDADLSPHHHFFCKRCKSIYDFTWEAFDKTDPPSSATERGLVNTKQVTVMGICKRCMEKDAS